MDDQSAAAGGEKTPTARSNLLRKLLMVIDFFLEFCAIFTAGLIFFKLAVGAIVCP